MSVDMGCAKVMIAPIGADIAVPLDDNAWMQQHLESGQTLSLSLERVVHLVCGSKCTHPEAAALQRRPKLFSEPQQLN